MGLYFNADQLQDARGEYVAWCDGMGTGSALSTSLKHAANFVFKLHRAFGNAVDSVDGARLYPLMDGMYVTSPSRDTIQSVIRAAYTDLAREFYAHKEIHKHFIVRGAVAYGATLHGADVPEEAFVHGIGSQHEKKNRKAFAESTMDSSRTTLLLSSAMATAYHAENSAPPFGVYVHDTALAIPQLVDQHDKGFSSRLWRWWRGNTASITVAKELAPALTSYFDKAEQCSKDLNYPLEAIKKHRESLPEYYGSYLQPPKKKRT